MAVIRTNVDIERIQLPTVAEVEAKLIIGQKGLATDTNISIERKPDIGGIPQFVESKLGINNFPDLLDTPADYIGKARQAVVVDEVEEGLEFITPTDLINGAGGIKRLWKGFSDTGNIGTVYNDATRTYSVYAIDDSTVDFRCRGVEFNLENTDPKLTVTLPPEKRPYFLYFDDNGQLGYQTLKTSDTVYQNNTLAPFLNLATDDDTNYYQNMTLNRLDDERANEKENFASVKTKRISGGDATVLLSGTLGGSTVSYSGGEYFSNIDHQFFIVADPTPVYPVFFLNGKDSDSRDYIDRNVKVDSTPYLSDGNNLFYNLNTGGVFSKEPLGNNKYVLAHFVVGDSDNQRVVSLAGQAEYGNLASAQSAIDSERASLILNKEVFRITGIIAACIFKSSGAVGQLQYVDGSNNLFNYPVGDIISAGSPTTQIPNLTSVLVQSPEGSAGGNPVHDLPDAILPQDPMTLSQTKVASTQAQLDTFMSTASPASQNSIRISGTGLILGNGTVNGVWDVNGNDCSLASVVAGTGQLRVRTNKMELLAGAHSLNGVSVYARTVDGVGGAIATSSGNVFQYERDLTSSGANGIAERVMWDNTTTSVSVSNYAELKIACATNPVGSKAVFVSESFVLPQADPLTVDGWVSLHGAELQLNDGFVANVNGLLNINQVIAVSGNSTIVINSGPIYCRNLGKYGSGNNTLTVNGTGIIFYERLNIASTVGSAERNTWDNTYNISEGLETTETAQELFDQKDTNDQLSANLGSVELIVKDVANTGKAVRGTFTTTAVVEIPVSFDGTFYSGIINVSAYRSAGNNFTRRYDVVYEGGIHGVADLTIDNSRGVITDVSIGVSAGKITLTFVSDTTNTLFGITTVDLYGTTI